MTILAVDAFLQITAYRSYPHCGDCPAVGFQGPNAGIQVQQWARFHWPQAEFLTVFVFDATEFLVGILEKPGGKLVSTLAIQKSDG